MTNNLKEPLGNPSGTQFLEEQNSHLRKTIAALRNSLELLKSEHEDNIQSKIQYVDEQNRELKSTIFALRNQLEKLSHDASTNLQTELTKSQSNLNELQNTIGLLRKNIEEDWVIVKGKTTPVNVYEILDYHTPESFPNVVEVLGHFKNGIEFYRE